MKKKIGLMIIMLLSMILLVNMQTEVFASRVPYISEDIDDVMSGYIFGNQSINQRRDDIARISVKSWYEYEELPESDGFYIFSYESEYEYEDGYVWFTVNEDDKAKYDLHIVTAEFKGEYLFANYKNCTEIIISVAPYEVWSASCEGMFIGCSSLTSLDLGDNFYTSNVTNMKYMFAGCSSLTSLDLGDNFYTSNVTNMEYMFYGCSSLTSLDLGNNFDTSNVNYMSSMFEECNLLTSIPNGFDWGLEAYTNRMFYNCNSLTNIVIDTPIIMEEMFYGCNNLTDITITSNVFLVADSSSNETIVNIDNGCFTYTGTGILKTTLINESSAMENYDWYTDKRVIAVPDTLAPTGTISLGSTYYEANGYKYVKSGEVTINLTASDNVSEQNNIKVALINENNYNRANANSSITWLDFSPSVQWTASSGKGLKRVYVIFKDEAGNQSVYFTS